MPRFHCRKLKSIVEIITDLQIIPLETQEHRGSLYVLSSERANIHFKTQINTHKRSGIILSAVVCRWLMLSHTATMVSFWQTSPTLQSAAKCFNSQQTQAFQVFLCFIKMFIITRTWPNLTNELSTKRLTSYNPTSVFIFNQKILYKEGMNTQYLSLHTPIPLILVFLHCC